MQYQESVDYLFSLGNEVSTMKLGLETITRLLAALDNPQNNYLKVQVAGTNGKGSVCAFLDAICRSAGIKTGVFTSPHLISITERVRLDGVDIAEEDFARFATIVRVTSERLIDNGELGYTPTFFEQITAIALLAFADANVELAILETGLGGRLDATTAAKAEIAAITRIDYDHQDYLGSTLAEIAAEKAAIIRPGLQAVIGRQEPEALVAILERCRKTGVAPVVADAIGSPALPLITLEAGQQKLEVQTFRLGLAGLHQAENAGIAASVAGVLSRTFLISKTDILTGLTNARHPGRLEYANRFLLDGAHNVGGTRALCAYLDEYELRPITLVFGAMKGKDVEDMAAMLFARADHIILTRPDNSRALTAEELAEATAEHADGKRPILTANIYDAVDRALELTDENAIILVTGSLYLIGEAKRILKSQI